ncbi:methyltransferase-like protein [Blastocystis sp. subtype 4]|uniref:methyltransferase-like protein n=1 Tax=Blastocystis sp. subtype 4 TaxID=944170 RepID=UPI0007120A3F|nr:methyltransferase-like protein [Blastocystis sp. subtype 4]KNB45035.1 methyltransferase-like protein [Blastocystis sp. subtype 4]|eukprot:XP_014528477.1 methyltransferase-like protein [Blastocystis sp. subtype 4]
MLHYLLFHALTSAHIVLSILATVVRTIAVSSSAQYTSRLPVPVSFNEPSRGVLNFILDYTFLEVGIQLQAGVTPSQIVTISGLLSGFSIEIQNSVVHFLLMGWEKNRVLSGFHWSDLRKEIVDDKIESIFDIAEKCLQFDPFSACQIVTNLSPAQPKAPTLQRMCKSVLLALTQTSEPFLLVCLLRLLSHLIPAGITPAMVPQCLQSVLQQQSVLSKDLKDEYCVIVAQIMGGVVQIPIRRCDQSVIEKCYSSLLSIILHSSSLVQSLCLQPLTVFMRTYPLDFSSLLPEQQDKDVLQSLLLSLKKPFNESSLADVNILQEKMNRRRERSLKQLKDAVLECPKDSGNDTDELIEALRKQFAAIQSRGVKRGSITKEEAMEWKSLSSDELDSESDDVIESGIVCGLRSDDNDLQQYQLDLADGTHLSLQCETGSSLDDVGKQIWSGSLLLCDYIAKNNNYNLILEIGCGVGLFSRVASAFSCHLIATDYKQTILDIAKINTVTCPNVDYRVLDLLSDSAYDVISPSERVDLVVAGDMVYDEVLTENMCRYLSSILSRHDCYCILSGEHRYNIVDVTDRVVDYVILHY